MDVAPLKLKNFITIWSVLDFRGVTMMCGERRKNGREMVYKKYKS